MQCKWTNELCDLRNEEMNLDFFYILCLLLQQNNYFIITEMLLLNTVSHRPIVLLIAVHIRLFILIFVLIYLYIIWRCGTPAEPCRPLSRCLSCWLQTAMQIPWLVWWVVLGGLYSLYSLTFNFSLSVSYGSYGF